MSGLVSKFKQLIPRRVDMLIYWFPESDKNAPVPEIDGQRLIQTGNEFQIKSDDGLIHRSRIFFRSNLLNNFNFSGPYLTIGDCLTDDRYRGKGIYPKVIGYLGKRFSEDYQVFILVSPDNSASIRGIEKAGFRYLARLQGLRLAFFYFSKKIKVKTP